MRGQLPLRRESFLAAILLLVVGMAGAGCGGDGAGGGRGGGGMPPLPVEVATVEATGVADRFRAVGSLEAELEVTVVSEIAAKVERLPFREGQEVEEGALLVQLDDQQLRAELARAEALVQRYRSTYERIRNVVERGAGSPQDLDDAEADLEVAEADLALVKARLDKTQIRAPFSGVTGARRISPGAFVRVGETITQLAQIDRLRVIFNAPERTLGRLDEGARVEVRTTAHPDLPLEGSIDVIEPVLATESRSARIVSHVDNRDGRLRPGMSADVTVTLGDRPQALTAPNEAIFFEGQQSFVYTIQPDSTVQRRSVALGTRLSDVVEIVGGVSAGDRVVRAGHQKLFPGAKVNPIEEPPSSADSATSEATS